MTRISLFLSILFSTVVFLSCSSDDKEDLFPLPSVPGIGLETGQVQLVYQATPENHEIVFEVAAKGFDLVINWGDTGEKHLVSGGEISYVYPAEEKTYIITMISTYLSGIDLTHEKARNIIGFYAGECPSFMDFSFNKDNLFEALDLTKCPQFHSFRMQVNTPNFDLSGLKNATSLRLYLAADIETDLKDFTALEKLTIYPDMDQRIRYKPIRIENSPNLTTFEMNSFSASGYSYAPYTTFLDGLSIKSQNLNRLDLSNQIFDIDLDLREVGKDSVVVLLNNCNFTKKLLMSPATHTLAIHNGWTPEVDNNIEELDLTDCDRLAYTQIEFLSHLKKIHLGDASNLKRFWLQRCPQITDLQFETYPELEEIDLFGNVNLKEVSMKDLPQLKRIAFTRNSILTGLSGTNIPEIARIEMIENALDEATLLSFFEPLPDTPSYEGVKRVIQLDRNPGYTEKVKALIESRENWEIVNYSNLPVESKTAESKNKFLQGEPNIIRLKGSI